MPFERFVETGRVAYISDGPAKGKLCSIVDVINQKRVLVDGPESGVLRQPMRLSQLHLTKFRVKFPFNAPTRIVRKSWKEGKINEKWSESTWARKIENKKKRAALTDFDRFKLRRARTTRNAMRTRAYLYLKKQKTKKVAEKKGAAKGKKEKPAAKKAEKKPPAKKPEAKKPEKK